MDYASPLMKNTLYVANGMDNALAVIKLQKEDCQKRNRRYKH